MIGGLIVCAIVALFVFSVLKAHGDHERVLARIGPAMRRRVDGLGLRCTYSGLGWKRVWLRGDLCISRDEVYVLRSNLMRQPPFRLAFHEDDVQTRAPGTVVRVTSMSADDRALVIDGDLSFGHVELRFSGAAPRTLLASIEAVRDRSRGDPYRTATRPRSM